MIIVLYKITTVMFDYEFNGEQKRTMLVGQIAYEYYKVNILYEDIEGSNEKYFISSNIRDFFDENDRIEKVKTIMKRMLNEKLQKEYMSVKWNIPKWLQKLILDGFDKL